MKEDEARRYFQQLINAVDYCHSRGVYHRDLKVFKSCKDGYYCLRLALFLGKSVMLYWKKILFFSLLFMVSIAARKSIVGCLWKPKSVWFWIECFVTTSQGNYGYDFWKCKLFFPLCCSLFLIIIFDLFDIKCLGM